VTAWYVEHGYDFLVLSDHNVLLRGERWVNVSDAPGSPLTPARIDELRTRLGADAIVERAQDGVRQMRLQTLEELRARFEQPAEFLLIEGEEVTASERGIPVHVNALNLAELVEPRGGATALEMAQANLDAVVEQGQRLGRPVLAHLNHPNFQWAVDTDVLARLRNERFFEVFNGHPATNGDGDELHPATERMWDEANARRLLELDLPLLYGIATDDSHHVHATGPALANAGRGWIQVRAQELSPEALLAALRAGEFYASTGVTLDDVRFDGRRLVVDVAREPGVTCTTRFLGADAGGRAGVVFAETSADPALYELDGRELFVRAKVVSSKPAANALRPGQTECAWTQPVLAR
jgi:hypothetical protein